MGISVHELGLFGLSLQVIVDGGDFLLDGNKGRKLAYLLDDTNLHSMLNGRRTIISYGSNQSNAMASLARFCALKGLEFVYVTHHQIKHIYKGSNLDLALGYGMKIIYFADYANHSASSPASLARDLAYKYDYMLICEGVCESFAEYGYKSLARFISEHFAPSVDVFLPSGTGTSAAFLQKHLDDRQVYTTPCYGDEEYLRASISKLVPQSKVCILPPPRAYAFGGLYDELYDMIMRVNQMCDVEFELLYDSVGLMSLAHHLDILAPSIIYIHQGGSVGHRSQLARYQARYSRR